MHYWHPNIGRINIGRIADFTIMASEIADLFNCGGCGIVCTPEAPTCIGGGAPSRRCSPSSFPWQWGTRLAKGPALAAPRPDRTDPRQPE
jgi:hypothetical protein